MNKPDVNMIDHPGLSLRSKPNEGGSNGYPFIGNLSGNSLSTISAGSASIMSLMVKFILDRIGNSTPSKVEAEMRMHYIQHVPFEDMANIEGWALDRGYDISKTLLYEDEPLPPLDKFDWLVVMGGSMNIYEHDKYPWLVREKDFLKHAISGAKIVLGICLGAQLIADVLGGKVRKNSYKEVGWHKVSLTPEASRSKFFKILPREFTAFQWHGDTFTVPPGAVRTAWSEACANQAFEYGKAIGLQFHLESSMDSIDHLIENCSDELVDGEYIQKPKELLSKVDRFPEVNSLMARFLENVEKEAG